MLRFAHRRHLEAIERALAFIERGIDGAIRLDDVARSIGMSAFHFHRMYRTLAGEAFEQSLRRLRMLHAVRLIKDHGASVTDAAFDAGYSSSQAFAKAFRAVAGVSVTEAKTQPFGFKRVIDRLRSHDNDTTSLIVVNPVGHRPFELGAFQLIGYLVWGVPGKKLPVRARVVSGARDSVVCDKASTDIDALPLLEGRWHRELRDTRERAAR